MPKPMRSGGSSISRSISAICLLVASFQSQAGKIAAYKSLKILRDAEQRVGRLHGLRHGFDLTFEPVAFERLAVALAAASRTGMDA